MAEDSPNQPLTIQLDCIRIVSGVLNPASRPMPEMEKLTINVSPVDLGRIELLVEQGFYANRAEFIRVAIHDQLAKHTDAVREAAARQSLVIGAIALDQKALEQYQKRGERLRLQVVGFASLSDDVSPDLAREVIESVKVHGIFKASPAVKDALKDRTA
jgi:Arc/MetJ-type ribon-helix-helix transcriptional regulator